MAANDTSHEIIVQALVERIRDLQKTIPGSAGDPWAVVDELVHRGKAKWLCMPNDPLAQRTFMLTGRPNCYHPNATPPDNGALTPYGEELLKEYKNIAVRLNDRLAAKDKALREIANAPFQLVMETYKSMASKACAV